MPADHESLTEALHVLAAERTAHDSFDSRAFLERAHRARTRRRSSRTAVAAAFLGVAVLFAALLPGHAANTRPIAPSPSPTRVITTTGADPLILDKTFGWLPPGLDSLSYVISAAPETSSGMIASVPYADPYQQLRVDASIEPDPGPYALSGHIAAVPIDPINGKQAQAQTGKDPNGHDAILVRFQSPSGQRTSLVTHGLTLQDASKIARTVVFGRKVLPLPIHVSGVNAPVDRAGIIYTTIHGTWAELNLDLAVKADHNYEAEIEAFPQGQPPTGDLVETAWNGRKASEDLNGIHIIAGLSDTVSAPYTATTARLFPEKTISDAASADVNDPTNYGDPTTFLGSHVTVLGTDPRLWTTSVLSP